MEGEVLVIIENELAGGPAQVAKRYLLLKGRRFEVFPDKPREGEVSSTFSVEQCKQHHPHECTHTFIDVFNALKQM